MASTVRARARQVAGNLPAEVTSFVGRRRDITLVKRLMAESRLVTLTGPPGVGKTRLALRVASASSRTFADKAWLVELEELRNPEMVVDAICEQLQLTLKATADDSDLIEQLKTRDMLLVFDNCEHVLTESARIVQLILRHCPGIRVLATSRQSLGIQGESNIVVTPLQIPDISHLPPPEAYEQYASVRLFVDRAKAVVPHFEVTDANADDLYRLAYHLEGNPLAIELAAVWLRSLTPHELAERLTQRYSLLSARSRSANPARSARQQSLTTLIDWSYELCTPRDRLTWARLSVFSGSFDLPAAEYVAVDTGPAEEEPEPCHARLSTEQLLPALDSLVDQSILLRDTEETELQSPGARFRIPRPLREYGAAKLAQCGDDERVRERHLDWFMQLVDEFDRSWFGPEQAQWINRLTRESGNLRAALSTALSGARKDPRFARSALHLFVKVANYWGLRPLPGEARHWLSQILHVVTAPSPERASALNMYAWFLLIHGQVDVAYEKNEEAAALAEQFGDELLEGHTKIVRGWAQLSNEEMDEATATLEDAVEIFRERPLSYGTLFALFLLGLVRGISGDVTNGLALLDECIQRAQEIGEIFFRSHAWWSKARVLFTQDRISEAEASAKQALRTQINAENRIAIALSIDILSWTAFRQDQSERAAMLVGAARVFWAEIGSPSTFTPTFTEIQRSYQDRIKATLGEESYRDACEQGRSLSPTGAIDLALEIKSRTPSESVDNEGGALGATVHPMPLTRRERQIAELVAEGRTNKDIAESLVIAQRTVEGHVQHILTKLDFSSRAQIAGWLAAQKTTR